MTGRTRRITGRLPGVAALLLAASLAILGSVAPLSAQVVVAASDGLTVTTSSTYTLDPKAQAVHVVVDVSARNDKPDLVSGGVRTRYFYDRFRIGVQPEARAFRATSAGRPVSVGATGGGDFITLDVAFLTSLFHGDTANVRVTFDLPGGAPRSASEVRVGPAFATFVAWAFGESGSVRIVIPRGFDPETSGSPLTKAAANGATVYMASGISDVPGWYAVVNADRPSALTRTRLDLAGGEHVVVHAWPNDRAWSKDVTSLLTNGLPELVKETGLDWPVAGDLSVFEVHTPLLEGYAGVFIESQNRIEISEDLDDLTILHEASHAWFNSALFTGRWINEGFADTFAARSLDALRLPGSQPGTVSPTQAGAVKLNDWAFPGRITDQATEDREQFGYDASWLVVRSLVEDVGASGMQAVLQAAERGDIAYVSRGTPEHVTGAADWRRLLDLLDERGGAKHADALFRTWVVNASEAKQLDARAAARTAYAKLVTDAGGWTIPIAVRGPMSDWQFPLADQEIGDAEAVLGQARDVAAVATELGVAAPTALRTAFESATGSLDAAAQVAADEMTTARAVKAAADAVAAPRAPLVTLGLLGTDPAARLRDVVAAFSAGAPTANADAAALIDSFGNAVQVGRERLMLGIVVLVVAIVALVIAAAILWRRRARRRLVAAAIAPAASPASDALPWPAASAVTASAEGGGPDSGPGDGRAVDGPRSTAGASATLADQSAGADAASPPPPADRGDAP